MSDAEVLGLLILGCQRGCTSLQLNLPDVDRLTEGVVEDGWYPLELYQKVCAIVSAAFPTSGPVFERLGIEGSKQMYEMNAGLFRGISGAEFLRSNTASYTQYVRGPAEVIGSIELVSLSEAEGKAVIRSTSVLPRDLERGYYYGGLELLGDIGFINIVTDHEHSLHHVEFH